jgi:hypothetical protein
MPAEAVLAGDLTEEIDGDRAVDRSHVVVLAHQQGLRR